MGMVICVVSFGWSMKEKRKKKSNEGRSWRQYIFFIAAHPLTSREALTNDRRP
jgi:hypothetical protein